MAAGDPASRQDEAPATCATCGSPQPAGARFCFRCGAALEAARCTACGAELVPGAGFCSRCGAAVGGPPAPAASRRVTSVLFGDLVAFTSLSEQRDQEEVRELLSGYFEECSRIVARYGGVVEKFIGDAVMAVWGVPVSHEDDAERSVRAGLELVSRVEALGTELAAPELRMRVGIVTGEVAVTVGAEQQGMVAGDPVNTASRIQSTAAPGEVWVDETTRGLTSAAIEYREEGSHHLKGKTEPVPLWSARAVTASVRGLRRTDELEVPLVGRHRELRVLKELFHATQDSGRAALVVVDGEAGSGKTRLAWELEKYLDGLQARVGWLTGRAAAYGEGVAFQPLADAVRGRLRTVAAPDTDDATHDGDGATALDRDLLVGLRRLVSDDQELAWLEPCLAVLLGHAPGARFSREDLFAAWSAFLEHVAEGRDALVWVVDDAQHADESFLQFVDYLLSAAPFPCLVVLLSRPGLLQAHPGLVTSRRATVLRLPPLGDREIGELVDTLVQGLPEPARETLVARSDGVPLFAVETVRALVARGQVVRRGGRLEVADPRAVDLASAAAPDSLQAVVRARLDALPPAQRLVVDRASVLGNAFTREEIAGLCADVPDLDGALAGLVRLEVLRRDLRRTSPEFGRYRFAQAVVAQVAAGMLSRRDLKAIHLAAVRQLEAEDDAGERAAVIAAHLTDAVAAAPGDPDSGELVGRLVHHLERAAERLAMLGAPGEAAAQLRTALRHVPDEDTRARLRVRLAWALVDAGAWQEVLEPARAARRWYDGQGDDVAASRAAAAEAQAMMADGDNDGALGLLEPHWEAVRFHADATEVQLALTAAMARARMRLGLDPRPALQDRLRLANLTADHEATADVYVSLAVYYLAVGAISLAGVLLQAAVDLAREHHLVRVLSRALTNFTAFTVPEDLGRAVVLGREAVTEATRSGLSLMRDYASLNLGIARFARGDWAGLREELAEPGLASDLSNLPIRTGLQLALDLARDEPLGVPWQRGSREVADHPGARAWQDHCEALLAWREGDAEEAVRLAVAGVEGMAALTGLSEDLSVMWPWAAEIVLDHGDDATLERLLQGAEQTGQQVPTALAAHARWVQGERAARTGAPEAEELLRDAIGRYEAWGSPVYAARARSTLAGLLLDTGRDREAADLAQEAREVFDRIAATAWLASVRP